MAVNTGERLTAEAARTAKMELSDDRQTRHRLAFQTKIHRLSLLAGQAGDKLLVWLRSVSFFASALLRIVPTRCLCR